MDRGEVGNVTEQPKGPFLQTDQEGRKQLVRETAKWHRLASAIGRILGPEAETI